MLMMEVTLAGRLVFLLLIWATMITVALENVPVPLTTLLAHRSMPGLGRA